MVEHAAVNRAVVGSSPTRGAMNIYPVSFLAGFFITCPHDWRFLRIIPREPERSPIAPSRPFSCGSFFHTMFPCNNGAPYFVFRKIEFCSCNPFVSAYTKIRCLAATEFLDSSMVEHAAVNRAVVGSSPTRGARFLYPRQLAGGDFLCRRLPSDPIYAKGWNRLCPRERERMHKLEKQQPRRARRALHAPGAQRHRKGPGEPGPEQQRR